MSKTNGVESSGGSCRRSDAAPSAGPSRAVGSAFQQGLSRALEALGVPRSQVSRVVWDPVVGWGKLTGKVDVLIDAAGAFNENALSSIGRDQMLTVSYCGDPVAMEARLTEAICRRRVDTAASRVARELGWYSTVSAFTRVDLAEGTGSARFSNRSGTQTACIALFDEEGKSRRLAEVATLKRRFLASLYRPRAELQNLFEVA